jgi:predicted NBD/HSP70 family sugar kinase
MRHYVGFDVGKGAHWVCVLDGQGEVVLSRKVEATEEALEAVCSEIAALGVSDERVVGIDLTGGVAALLEAVLLERGEKVRYLPGTAVNKAREA